MNKLIHFKNNIMYHQMYKKTMISLILYIIIIKKSFKAFYYIRCRVYKISFFIFHLIKFSICKIKISILLANSVNKINKIKIIRKQLFIKKGVILQFI